MSDHPELEALIAVYVLGAVGPEEAESVRTHLAGCAECRQLAARLQRAVDALPMATELEPPPAQLKAGILMSLDSYLRANPDPGEADIRIFLTGHLCRCTGYVPIVAAALDAARTLREAAHA